MRYEHLIEINNPLLTLTDHLTRKELWEGLVQRAYEPQRFIQGLEGSTIKELSCNGLITVLARTLDFGMFRVDDRVTLLKNTSTTTDVEPSGGVAKSRLTITIEEPAEHRIYLRFLYEIADDKAINEHDSMTLAIREQAYFASDMDTVARIRELAAIPKMQ